jgi:hypothetical protein
MVWKVQVEIVDLEIVDLVHTTDSSPPPPPHLPLPHPSKVRQLLLRACAILIIVVSFRDDFICIGLYLPL